jgi:hypothetical protein
MLPAWLSSLYLREWDPAEAQKPITAVALHDVHYLRKCNDDSAIYMGKNFPEFSGLPAYVEVRRLGEARLG